MRIHIINNIEVYVFILLLIIGIAICQSYIDKYTLIVAIQIDTLTEFDRISINILTEMNKLLIAFSTLLFGTVGAFAFKNNNYKKGVLCSRILMIVVYITASISIYSGYILYNNIINQLSNHTFQANENSIIMPQKLQFYSFLMAVILLFVNIITYKKKGDEEL